jgi:hypothetical protein
MDAVHRKQREDLLTAALEADSWKARYVDAVWSSRFPKAGETTADGAARMRALAEQGIPIAVYMYGTYAIAHRQFYFELHDAAIDRGNPQSMTLIGGSILYKAPALRPMAKEMLECAVAQGYGKAYDLLGTSAQMEGRRVDAYRLWAEGVNKGCVECVNHLRALGLVRTGTTERPVN